jgi:hypothetical protein
VLTLRFFIQENEPSSFRWLAKNALKDADVSAEWKQGFTKIRRQLTDWLDSPSDLNLQYELERVTRGLPAMQEGRLSKHEIMQVYIYGDAAHVNPRYKEMFDRWKANPIWFAMAQLEFDHVLMGVFKAIWAVARLSEHELAHAS